jgi:Tfp pilus assembly protein PilV
MNLRINTPARGGHGEGGFSMIELLLTVVIATIVFAAMVPLFGNVLHNSFRDSQRNYAQIIAQDRIEQIRLLDYNAVTQSSLTSPVNTPSPFGDGRFGTTYTLAGQKPYTVTYHVTPETPSASPSPSASWSYKLIQVTVVPADGGAAVTMTSVLNDPMPHIYSVSSAAPSPLPSIGGLTIGAYFKDWTDVTTKGAVVTRVQTNVTPNVTFTPTPVKQVPTSASPTCRWTGLTGGTNYTYTISVYSINWQSGNTPFVTPPFHLLTNALKYFDTNPGGS